MTDDNRVRMRKLLLDSYLPRHVNDCACAKCGRRGIPLAFHVIEKTVSDKYGKSADRPFERGFEPFASMLSSVGYVRGSFPLCSACAPPCSKCKLPTDPPSIHKFALSVKGKIGLGVCREHLHWFVVVAVVRYLWLKWACPAQILADQAAHLGWIAAGVETRVSYKNIKFSRNGMVSLISHRDRNIELLVPRGPHLFRDFDELERWFATPTGKISKEMAECMAEADTAANAVGDVPATPETIYFQEVDDCIRMMGDRGDHALDAQLNTDFMAALLYAQLNPDFMAVSFEVYMTGFRCDVPPKILGDFIGEAADTYKSNPSLGISCLEHIRDRIPQLWSSVR